MNLNMELISITLLSIMVSGIATLIGALIGIPLGSYIGLKEFPGKDAFKTLTFTLYGFPPVVAGLIVYMIISSNGPLGSLHIIFTPTAMILAQTLLVLPIIVGLTISAVSDNTREIKDTAIVLGADERQTARTIINESRVPIISAVMVGFGRAIAEVGAVIIVGGNIKWHTRVLTTAIVLETRKGNFEYGLVLGLILMTVAMIVFLLLKKYQEKEVI